LLGNCSACPVGKISDGVGNCTACESGKFAPIQASTKCTICPVGKYSTEPGQSSCLDCTAGKYGPIEGSTSENTCFSCSRGKMSNLTGSSACSNCEEGTWNDNEGASTQRACKPCPQLSGVVCLSGTAVPWVDTGFYRSPENEGDIAACYPSDACPQSGFGNTSCADGYRGDLCSHCQTEYFRTGGHCVKCLNRFVRWMIIAGVLLGLIIIFAKLSERADLIPPAIRMSLFWFQFLSLFPSMAAFWPPVLRNVLNFTNIFNLDLGYLGISCDISSQSYFLILAMKISMPMIFSLVLILENLLMYAFKFTRKLSLLKISAHAIFLTNFFSIQLFSSMLQVFNCVDSQSALGLVVSQEPSVTCYDQNWNYFVVFDGFCMFIYMVVVPLTLFFKIRKWVKAGDKESMYILTKSFAQFYREGCTWFEVVKVIIRLGFVLVRDALQLSLSSKITFLGILLMILIWLESRTRPYAEEQQNDLSLL
jgi:hypothetical protein